MIGNWYDLIEFISTINPNNETIFLTGWINEIQEGRTYIRQLYFTTKDVNVLKKEVNKNEHIKSNKKFVVKNTRK